MSIIEVANESQRCRFPIPGYPDFIVEVEYLDPRKIKSLAKAATKPKFNEDTRSYEDEVDNEVLAKLMTVNMVKGWTGLDVETLKDFVNLSEASEQKIKSEMDGIVPFSEADLHMLVDNTPTRLFIDPVTKVALDLKRIRELKEESMLGNSGASQPT